MIVVYALLFIVGFYLFGVAFNVDQAFAAWVFLGGILCVSLALALPISLWQRENKES